MPDFSNRVPGQGSLALRLNVYGREVLPGVRFGLYLIMWLDRQDRLGSVASHQPVKCHMQLQVRLQSLYAESRVATAKSAAKLAERLLAHTVSGFPTPLGHCALT